MAESFQEKRRKQLGLTDASDFQQQRMMDLGMIPDARPKQPSIGPEMQEFVSKNLLPSRDKMLGSVDKFLPQTAQQSIEPKERERPLYIADNAGKDMSNDPSRKLPVIGPVLKGLDWVANKTLPAAEIAGALYTPGGGLANMSGFTSAVGQGLAKVAPKLGAGSGVVARVGAEAVKEGTLGAPLTAIHSAVQGDSNKEIAKQGAIGAALGGGLGAAGPVAGKALKGISSKVTDIIKKYRPTQEAPQPLLALPEPKARGNMNTVVTDDVITPEYTFKLPKATDTTKNNVAAVREAWKDIATIDEELRVLNIRKDEAVNDQFKHLVEQLKNRQGSVGKGVHITPDGGYANTKGFSLNPEWYQEYHSQYGKFPNRKEIYEIAKKHIEEGYVDGGVQIPPWKVQNNYDETVQALGDVKNTIRNSLKERGLNLTNAELKGEALGFDVTKKVKSDPIANNLDPSLPKVESVANEVEPIQPKPVEVLDDILESKEPRMRDKVVSYLDEAESAARERLKAKRNTLSSMPIDQYADYAIIGAAKIGKGVVKFADWSEQMVKEFGDEIKPHLQKIYNRSIAQLKDAERRATKQAQEARAFNESDLGDSVSFRSKVNRDTKKGRIPFSKRWEAIRTQFVDDMAPLEGVEKRIRGSLASAENSLYKAARLFKGVPEKANHIVKERLAPIINGIEKKGYTSADLGDYALAVHAKDVNARDIKSGWTNKEIDDVINRLGTPEMEAARKEIIKISDDMLAELQKEGVISGELVAALKERYPNYMPLFRSFDDDKVEFAVGLSKALANVTSPIKGLKGSERQVADPFESMVKNIFQSTNAAERNKVASQLIKLADDDIDGSFIRRLAEGEEVGRKNIVTVLQGGEKVRIEVEPEVYKSMMDLDKESSIMLINILQKPASVLRAGATLTPEFSLRNPIRDVVQAFVTSKSGFNPLIDFPVGLIQSISKGDLYKQWIKELGGYGNIVSNDRRVHKEALERVLKEPIGKKFINVLNGKTLIKVLRAISDTTESATKVGEFRSSLRKGFSPQEAAYQSRDVMDFGRAGSNVRQANKIVAFLNANIQGKSKILRAFKENPAGFSTRAFTAVTVPSIGVFIMQKEMSSDFQKQTIAEAPQWQKDTFWLVPVPGTNQVARIPKPFDLSTLFSNLPERALEYIFNNDKEAFNDFAKRSLEDMALPGMISGLLPIIEGMANYSFFQGRSIIPRGEEGRNYEDQHDINTTETAKFLAKGAEKTIGKLSGFKNFSSPRVMDNTIRGLTAGLGSYATSAIDVMLDKFNFTDNPVRPDKGAAQKPLAKAFLVNPLQGGKSTEKLYDLKDVLNREKGSAKLNQRPFKDVGKLKFVDDTTSSMSDITTRIKEIENSRTLSGSEKREMIEKLVEHRNQLARNAMKRIEGRTP